jgi:glycosyltransferase involved in cell wall biosynthesis
LEVDIVIIYYAKKRIEATLFFYDFMKVLWITNILLPEALDLLKKKNSLKGTGGWLVGAANALINQKDIELYVASVTKEVNQLKRLEGKSVTYYYLPYGKGNKRVNHEYESYWRDIRDAILPDVIHIHGTEFSHGLAYIEACGSEHVCVSIQGLTSVYARYYLAGLKAWDIRKSFTPASLYKGSVIQGCKDFLKRGEYERELLRKVDHIIGRTSWDKAHAWAINPKAEYHYGGETLRSDFYSGRTWDYSRCTPHSIFLSQADYPIKGLHVVLNAMPLVLRQYPDATLRIAGGDITRSKGWIEKLKLSDYGKIVRNIIRDNILQHCVYFTGPLDGDGMRREYLRSNVFICPSSIENSPNSLGEAQILGVPIIASYEGGVMDMMRGNEDNLYRFEEVEMLAYKIVALFEKKDNIDTVYMRKAALERHDPQTNATELIKIYSSICEKNKSLL